MIISSSNVAARTLAIAALGLATLTFSPVSSAQGVFSNWSGAVSLGANRSSGNSESSNVNGSVRIAKTAGRWEHLLFGSIFKGNSTVVTVTEGPGGVPVSSIVRGDTSDRLSLGYQPKFLISDATYAFGILDYEEDEPANIESSLRQVIGIGHKFFSTESTSLSGEIGIGNRSLSAVTGDDLNGAIGYLGVNYLNKFTDTTLFNADFRSDFGSDNTFTELSLGLAFKLSSRFSFKVSHFIRNNSDLLSTENPLAASTDSVSTISLEFAI